jgi:inorganic pyrophosphatase
MSDEVLTCRVEIPKGSRNKYEYDLELGAIKLDRFVSASVVYPTDYGYVFDTLAPDGDPLDVLLCVSEPTFPGCIVEAKPIGLLKMADEKGPDDHVVCVPCHDPAWNQLDDIDQLPRQLRDEIRHFFFYLQGPRQRAPFRDHRVGRTRGRARDDQRGPRAGQHGVEDRHSAPPIERRSRSKQARHATGRLTRASRA